MTLYIDDKPYLIPDEVFDEYYRIWREDLMEESFSSPGSDKRIVAVVKINLLDEYAALRQYVRKDNPDFPYGEK